MVCWTLAPSDTWLRILQFLIGVFHEYELLCGFWRFAQIRPVISVLSNVHKRVLESLLTCSFMDVYQSKLKALCVVSSRLRLSQLCSHPWNAQTRQCAVRACTQQTGIWTPVNIGAGIQYAFSEHANYCGSIMSSCQEPAFSPQKTIESMVHGSSYYLIVCSSHCYRYAHSLVRFSHCCSNVIVARGTHLAHPRLLHRLAFVLDLYQTHSSVQIHAPWSQFNNLIDTLDVSMDNLDAKYCALFMKWSNARALGLTCVRKLRQKLLVQIGLLMQADLINDDIALCQPCPFDVLAQHGEPHGGDNDRAHVSSDSSNDPIF